MVRRLRNRLRQEEGFGLMELLITLTLLSISIAGLLTIFLSSAVSLSRAGLVGTATVIMDRDFEYYRRAPWGDIRLVKSGPGGSWGVTDSNITGDALYSSQCSGCPSGASNVIVDDDETTHDVIPNTSTPYNSATCNDALGTGDPDTDSSAPITDCLAEATVFGADGKPYRVYTYMKYACGAQQWLSTTTYAAGDDVQYNGTYYHSVLANNTNHSPPSTTPTWWTTPASCPVDYRTKVVTLVVRLLKNDLTLADTSNKGMLAKQTEVFAYGSFTTLGS